MLSRRRTTAALIRLHAAHSLISVSNGAPQVAIVTTMSQEFEVQSRVQKAKRHLSLLLIFQMFKIELLDLYHHVSCSV